MSLGAQMVSVGFLVVAEAVKTDAKLHTWEKFTAVWEREPTLGNFGGGERGKKPINRGFVGIFLQQELSERAENLRSRSAKVKTLPKKRECLIGLTEAFFSV